MWAERQQGVWRAAASHWGLHTQAHRDESFARLTDSDLQHFRGILGDTGIVQDAKALEAHNR